MKKSLSLKRIAFIFAVFILAGCSRGTEVKSIQPKKTKVETVITTTTAATVEAESDAVLGFGVAGRVGRIYQKLGSAVSAGTLIAELENQDVKSGVETSESELKRSRELFKSSLISQSALDEAKRSYEVAKMNYDRTRIVAPFDGVISEHNLEVGELFQLQDTSGKASIRLIDQKPRRVKGRIDEMDVAKVKIGTTARVRIQALQAEQLEATVVRLVPFISTSKDQDRTAEVYLQLKEQKRIIPVGASADVEIIIDQKEEGLAVSSRAVLGVGQSRYMWKIVDGRLKKTPVKLGIGNYEKLEILEGVSPQDWFALSLDTIELTEGMKVRSVETQW